MKKALISMLIILVLGCGAVFAASIESSSSYNGFVDYLGFNVGYGITNEKYDFVEGGPMRVDKGYQLSLSVNDFMFLDRDAILGFYMEVGFSFNIDMESTIGDEPSFHPKDLSPFYADTMLGLAIKFKTDNRTSVMIGVGPEIMYYSKEYNSQYWPYYTVDTENIALGFGADIEGSYRLGQDLYVGLGFKGSVLLYATTYTSVTVGPREHHTWDDLINYFGYRIQPRVSLYLQY